MSPPLRGIAGVIVEAIVEIDRELGALVKRQRSVGSNGSVAFAVECASCR
jgi:hypothetical protein